MQIVDEISPDIRDIELLVQHGSSYGSEDFDETENFYRTQRKEMHSNYLRNHFIMSENRGILSNVHINISDGINYVSKVVPLTE